MRAKQTAILLAVVFVAYAGLIGWRGVLLIKVGTPVSVVLGLAVLVIPVIGAYLVWREIQFGRRTEALARELEAAGGLPVDDLPRRPSGRVDRAAADEAFGRYKAEAEAAPGRLAGVVPAVDGVRRRGGPETGPGSDANRHRAPRSDPMSSGAVPRDN